MPPLLGDGASTVSGVRRQGDSAPAWAAAAPRPPPGMLALSIQRRGAVIELGLSGELDMATARRLGDAMARLRSESGPATPIVVDTSDVDRVTDAGYRHLRAALVGPNGLWDPKVALIVDRPSPGPGGQRSPPPGGRPPTPDAGRTSRWAACRGALGEHDHSTHEIAVERVAVKYHHRHHERTVGAPRRHEPPANGPMRLPSGLVQAGLVGEDHGLDAVAQAELHQDPLDVGADGGFLDDERARRSRGWTGHGR